VGREVGDDLLGILADVVVVDANLAGALAAAETLDVPTAVLLHSVYATYTDVWFASLWPLLGAAICDTRRAFGLGMVDGWPEVFAGHDRLLAVVPSVFDPPPSSAVVPPTVRRFGFLVPRSSVAAGDVVAFPEGAGPCVLVSLGTTSQGQAAALERIVDELSSMPVRAVVTTAGQAPELASTANVTVVDFVPHAALLPAVDVVVTHAGLGTVAAALEAGVPLVCVPFDRDQPLNAARVAELGAGVVASVDDVGSAVSRVLGDPSFRERAAWLADASRAEGGADAAVRELESLL
jgi:UDP:flavonoid glycosyltransferase YjiC (YdhE family)